MENLNHENEIWKDIPEYEGLYKASNWGRVKTLDKCDIRGRKFKEKILKLSYDKDGYQHVHLKHFGRDKLWPVHRLVWITFNGVIPEGMQINHINEVKTDNRLSNLNLMTCKENNNWGTRNERISRSKINGKKSKPVLQFDLNNNLIKEWPSAMEVQRKLNFNQSPIGKCCRNKLDKAYGFKWQYK